MATATKLRGSYFTGQCERDLSFFLGCGQFHETIAADFCGELFCPLPLSFATLFIAEFLLEGRFNARRSRRNLR